MSEDPGLAPGLRRPSLLLAVIIGLGLGLCLPGCATTGARPGAETAEINDDDARTDPESAPAVGQTVAEPAISADHLEWETATRNRCDKLILQAREHSENGRTVDALRCLDQAVAELLTVPSSYRIRQVYLDYLAQILAEAEALERALEVESAAPDPTDELVELPLIAMSDNEQEADDPASDERAGSDEDAVPDEGISSASRAPELASPEDDSSKLPASDVPLVLNPTVERFLEAFTTKTEYRDRIRTGLERSGTYLPMIREQLAETGLPLDLAYLPLIESAFSNSAYSRARAVGMWQFISGTGRAYGLEIGPLLDERRDPVHSTRAAAEYLADLYDELDDWYLALAAYNSGAGNVRRAIRRAGSRDFWRLRRYLPRETRNYVPAYLASVMVAKRPGLYGLEAPAEHPWDRERLEVHDALDLQVLARRLELEIDELRRINPAIRRDVTPGGNHTTIWLPAGRLSEAEEVLATLPRDEWAPRLVHTVRNGESLYTIARRLGSSVAAIRSANHLRGSLIRPGQTLIVPRLGLELDRPRAASRATEGGIYQVRPSDTLWDISQAFGVPLDRLCSVNGLTERSVIQPGQSLRIPLGASSVGFGKVEPAKGPGSTYRVQQGDTLYRIARRFGITVAELRRANNLRGSRIYPGDLLRLPS